MKICHSAPSQALPGMPLVFLVLSLFLFLPSIFVLAQNSAFVATPQSMHLLPGNVNNVSVVDGELYCCASGVLMKARRSGAQVLEFFADTDFVKLEDDIEYVVRHPVSGDIYFTRRDRHGDSWLYRCINYGHKEQKTKMVRIGGGLLNRGMTIEHPTFSQDGNILVFSSAEAHGANYNLWYTHFDGEDWVDPKNLTSRVNTKGDEVSPMIYGDYLVYATNGQSEDGNRMTLYSTLLKIDKEKGRMEVGAVQRLPFPINDPSADDIDIVADTHSNCAYWLSRRNQTDADTLLYSLSGPLEGVMLWGRVVDKAGRPLTGVKISSRQDNDLVCSTTTDADGHYRMYLQSDHYYSLSYQLDGFFVNTESINTVRTSGQYLIAEEQRNVTLDRLPLGQRIFFDDLYRPGTDVELSERGKEVLSPLVRYLNDNPAMLVEMTLVNDLADDKTFNSLLTDQRIISLQAYLYPLLPSTVKISIANGCDGVEGCRGATGMSRLTVLIYSTL